MEFGAFGIFVLVISCACSFLLARWLGKRRREARRQKERRAAEAGQSRQVRRARERQQRR
ncbi:MAG: hypothetical protein EOP82_00150 [Variovorax sp.]|nr:MAG: hypothetical protein EOP82_00150 [Variovorax sp.]